MQYEKRHWRGFELFPPSLLIKYTTQRLESTQYNTLYNLRKDTIKYIIQISESTQ